LATISALTYFGLPGFADHFVPLRARWKQFGFGSQALCFFGKESS
jgi:hypothetical protein